jgi:inosine/xanthosine triphosphatase
MKSIVGGTFHTLHAGHISLLREALKFDKCEIGLTSDAYVKRHKIYPANPYKVRRKQLLDFLRQEGARGRATIVQIDDEFGPSVVEKGLDAILVSEETATAADRINARRGRKGMKELGVIIVPLVYGGDLKKISCLRIHRGIIDAQGKRLKPVALAIGTENPVKIEGVREAASHIFKCGVTARETKTKPGVPEQPFGIATLRGAENRAKQAFAKAKGADYGIGLESGLFQFGKRHYDILWCAVHDETGTSFGCSMGFEVPAAFVKRMKKERKDMGRVFSEVSGIHEIGKKKGAIHFMSCGLLERKGMVLQAVKCAFIPRLSREVFSINAE